MPITVIRTALAILAVSCASQVAFAQPLGGGGAPSDPLPSATGPQLEPTFVGAEVVRSEPDDQGQEREGEHFTFEVAGPEGNKVRYTLTTLGGTVYSAVLHKEQYVREPLAPLANQGGIPASKLSGGPIDVVTTWNDIWLPYRLELADLSYPDPIVRVVRRAVGSTVEEGRILRASDPTGVTVNRPVRAGDQLTVTAPPELAGDYRVRAVLGGAIDPEPAFPVTAADGVAYTIQRRLAAAELYRSDADFVRISDDGAFPVVYAWPDPAVDDSPMYVEKSFDVGSHPYELILDVRIHHVGEHKLSFRSGLKVSAWQHPDADEGNLFQRPSNLWASTCFTDESLERFEFPELQDDASDAYQEGQGTQFVKVFPTPTRWISVDTTYFMAAAVPMTGGPSGQCAVGFNFWPQLGVGSWVQTATHMTTTRTELLPAAGGCLPEWLVDRHDGVSCEAAYRELGLDPGASFEAIDTAWSNKRGDSAADAARTALRSQRVKPYRYKLYMGPKDVVFMNQTDATLKESQSLGIFGFIAKPLHSLLRWLEGGVGSWALAIILLTIMIKLVTLPLTQKSYKSMQKMQQLKPKLEELKAKHEGDRQQFAREQMALFKREGVNPLTGCLPMLLQMPIWFALYTTIYASVELYNAPMGLWIDDLSSPDPYYIMPIFLGGLMFVQTFLTTSTATLDGMQGKILKFGMPIMFSVFMLFLPAGLVLYILVNVTLTIVQNLFIRRRMQTP